MKKPIERLTGKFEEGHAYAWGGGGLLTVILIVLLLVWLL